MDDTFELAATSLTTPRKRRGRPPRKADTVLLPTELTALGVLHTASSQRKPRKQKMPSKVDDSPSDDAAMPSIVGQAVYGVVDGSFDAGFLVSLRVGESENVYRGVVFGPGLSIPLSKDMDVATKVKIVSRSDGPVSTSPPSSSAPPAATEDSPQAEVQAHGIPPVNFNGYGAPSSDNLTTISQQKLVTNPILQSNFVHSAAPSFHLAAQSFGLIGNQFHFNVGTEFGYGGTSAFGATGQGR